MNYYFSTIQQDISFEEAKDLTIQKLKQEGFGVISEIDFQKTFKEKLGINFKRYTILQVCSPNDAFQSLQTDDKMGLLLPCNVLIQEQDGSVEICSIDPNIMMQGLENDEMQKIAAGVSQRLQRVLDNL